MSNALLLLGVGSTGSSGGLTPPTVAPVLTVTAEMGSGVAELSWTPSNKTNSDGFGYKIYRQPGMGAPAEHSTTTNLSAQIDETGDAVNYPGQFTYYIIPFNSAGEGPSSNTESINLPGESEAPVLTGPEPPEQTGSFQLTWTRPGPLNVTFDKYRLYRADTEDGEYALVATVNTSPRAYTADTTGFYKVAAYSSETETEGALSDPAYGEIVDAPAGDDLLLEDGSQLLLEDDTAMLLESAA